MQFKKTFSLTAQELSHAQWSVENDNYDTELSKAIQRKLLGHLIGTADDPGKPAPIMAADLMDNCHVHFVLGIDEDAGFVSTAPVHDEIIFTCHFLIPPKIIEQYDLSDAADVAKFQARICEGKDEALYEEHASAMKQMLDSGNVIGFEEAYTNVVELDDGVLVTHSVKPIYQIH